MAGKAKAGKSFTPKAAPEAVAKYRRGQSNKTKGLADKKQKAKLKQTEKLFEDGANAAAMSEMLLPSEAGYLEAEGMEKTQRFKQLEIKENVVIESARKSFNLQLADFAPYTFRYSKNGRSLILGGRKGHVALLEWGKAKIQTEFQAKETVRDVTFLHNERMFAVAQKKYTYIYDAEGIELHCIRTHIDINRLEFLPYHFLLVSVGNAGYLKYQDTSTGSMVAEHRTKLGSCDCMRQNPYNAVVTLGHTNGNTTMWTPNMNTPVVKMLCHRGPVTSLAFDLTGRYMVTAGMDCQVHVWDVRKYKKVHSYKSPMPTTTLDVSQRGLISMGFGAHVEIWKDALSSKAQAPYMRHDLHGPAVQTGLFCPFDDVLGVGHERGFSSLIIPGAGEPNFDTFEANPYETTKQRRESEVHALLEKINPDMIQLDPNKIGTVDKASKQVLDAEKAERQAAIEAGKMERKARRRQRGRSTAMRRFLKKQHNVVDAKRENIREQMEKKRKAKEERELQEKNGTPTVSRALKRFKK
eukprot:TRINITY_DN16719_c0_g1_i2.p1 TRINITY_DN16719_c0_g1~~TRINITY_DN16719_c0_g1_i2.p1  ORF type:complete len:524 (-),score=132.62 TRINITY_DN16719_c0_g1_i2:372-1943(-)